MRGARNIRGALLSLVIILFLGVLATTYAFSSNGVQSLDTTPSFFIIPTRKCSESRSATCLKAVQDNVFEGILSKLSRNNEAEDRNDANPPKSSPKVPFVIQRIGRGNKKEIEELTRLCIDVFFNEQNNEIDGSTSTQIVPPWKAVQLSYLRNSQSADIFTRNAFKKNQNVDIIVARRVYSLPAGEYGKKVKYVNQSDQIFNRDQLPRDGDERSNLVLGKIIGYCEVIEKNFGLGGKFSSDKPRPYLANLSVSKSARQSGIGSKLLDACDEVVRDWKAGHTTIVLQVEEDNTDAIRFYKKRGWEFVYADPTCRRFDTSGFFLKESRITKYAMVKQIDDGNDRDTSAERNTTELTPLQKVKSLWFVSQ